MCVGWGWKGDYIQKDRKSRVREERYPQCQQRDFSIYESVAPSAVLLPVHLLLMSKGHSSWEPSLERKSLTQEQYFKGKYLCKENATTESPRFTKYTWNDRGCIKYFCSATENDKILNIV